MQTHGRTETDFCSAIIFRCSNSDICQEIGGQARGRRQRDIYREGDKETDRWAERQADLQTEAEHNHRKHARMLLLRMMIIICKGRSDRKRNVRRTYGKSKKNNSE